MAQYKIALILVAICLLSAVGKSLQDTPANCTYEDIRGSWLFQEGPRGQSKSVDCSSKKPNVTSSFVINLEFPNTATDQDGNVGFWTIIYNQGFEVVVNNRKYFAFSYYTQSGSNVTSYCDKTFWGWCMCFLFL